MFPTPAIASMWLFSNQGVHIGAAKLWYDKPRKQFYLLVSLEIEVADPTPETHTGVVGVDVGIRYLAVTATTRGDHSFHSGKRIVPKANHYARLRKRLQKKGTRSATRRAVVMSGRERRLKQDANHVVSRTHRDQAPPFHHRLGEPDRHPRAHQTQERQESEQEATTGQ